MKPKSSLGPKALPLWSLDLCCPHLPHPLGSGHSPHLSSSGSSPCLSVWNAAACSEGPSCPARIEQLSPPGVICSPTTTAEASCLLVYTLVVCLPRPHRSTQNVSTGQQGHTEPQSQVTRLRGSPPARTKPGPEQALQKPLCVTTELSRQVMTDSELVWEAWGSRPGQCVPRPSGVLHPAPRPRKHPPLHAPPRSSALLRSARAVPAPPTRLPQPPGGQCTKGHFSAQLQLRLQPQGLRVGEGRGALCLACLHRAVSARAGRATDSSHSVDRLCSMSCTVGVGGGCSCTAGKGCPRGG